VPELRRATIRKETERPGWPTPNLGDYESVRAAFRWERIRGELSGLPGDGGLNIAYEAVDRHAEGPWAERAALRWVSPEGETAEYSYRQLSRLSNRFANALGSLGIEPGERVFTFTGRRPELYVAALGALKNRNVLCPLFSAFGPEPLLTRLSLGDARAVVTTEALYKRRLAAIRQQLPGLRHIIIVGGGEISAPGLHRFDDLIDSAAPEFSIPATHPEDWALLHFTSGTTGVPKGAVHVHDAALAHYATARYALDIHPGDVYWCTADPGWVTGCVYGIFAPLMTGATVLVDEQDFDPQRWLDLLESQTVNVWYTAPTAIRMMMRLGSELARERDLSSLRFMASVGEPLNPEAVIWGLKAFGRAFHDTWWQTETGAIMISNFASMDIKPGSMGRPVPGIEAAIVRRRGAGRVEALESPDQEGELALRRGWPSMFRGYLANESRYAAAFAGEWYLTGDLARRDADGYYWFIGRADDVIKSSGHLIGPFEVESTLLEHKAVAEAGVIGKPDPIAGELVKAFVSLKPGYAPGEPMVRELLAHARKRLGAAVAPKEIEFRNHLPRTRSGKILRRLLKAEELGLPAGDTSTLEAYGDGGKPTPKP